ncbi:MAG TPA: sugar phosphate isomerase/epimerase [Sphaerochaeta sp.]|nr:sugar phosphate isomerase/epimerase [Sphaerochaeta sp.]
MKQQHLRIGTTSYILADDILPNVRYLAPLVDDIELVLFESEGMSNLPSKQVIEELAALAGEHNLSYTVHFPLDIQPGSADPVLRAGCVSSILSIIGLTRSLNPFGYVLHLTPELHGNVPSLEVERWHDCCAETLQSLLERADVCSEMFCIETLSYPFCYVQDLVERFDLSVTLDIGHVWLMGYDSSEVMDSLLDRTRICHLHGVKDETDHLGLDQGDVGNIEYFLKRLRLQGEQDGVERVLTLEVFSEAQFHASLSLLQESHAMMN